MTPTTGKPNVGPRRPNEARNEQQPSLKRIAASQRGADVPTAVTGLRDRKSAVPPSASSSSFLGPQAMRAATSPSESDLPGLTPAPSHVQDDAASALLGKRQRQIDPSALDDSEESDESDDESGPIVQVTEGGQLRYAQCRLSQQDKGLVFIHPTENPQHLYTHGAATCLVFIFRSPDAIAMAHTSAPEEHLHDLLLDFEEEAGQFTDRTIGFNPNPYGNDFQEQAISAQLLIAEARAARSLLDQGSSPDSLCDRVSKLRTKLEHLFSDPADASAVPPPPSEPATPHERVTQDLERAEALCNENRMVEAGVRSTDNRADFYAIFKQRDVPTASIAQRMEIARQAFNDSHRERVQGLAQRIGATVLELPHEAVAVSFGAAPYTFSCMPEQGPVPRESNSTSSPASMASPTGSTLLPARADAGTVAASETPERKHGGAARANQAAASATAGDHLPGRDGLQGPQGAAAHSAVRR